MTPDNTLAMGPSRAKARPTLFPLDSQGKPH